MSRYPCIRELDTPARTRREETAMRTQSDTRYQGDVVYGIKSVRNKYASQDLDLAIFRWKT